MNCPYCGNTMEASGPMLEGCEGKKGAKHEPIQNCGIDRSFQTYSDQIAAWFRQKGHRVEKPGNCTTSTRLRVHLVDISV